MLYRPIYKCEFCQKVYELTGKETEDASLLAKETTHICNENTKGISKLVGYKEIEIDYTISDGIGW